MICVPPLTGAPTYLAVARVCLLVAARQELERLLVAKADINAADNAGLVPLHVAAGEGASEAVRWLCEHGADVNVRTRMEELTALHRVVEEGFNECLEILVASGADLTAR